MKEAHWRALHLTVLVSLVGLVGVLTISCGSSDSPATPPPGQPDGGVVEQDAGGDAIGIPPVDAGPFLDTGPCVPQPIDCTDKCGPVRDQCSGDVKLCGGCATGEVCDLTTHKCGTPKKNCADFGAECGQIKDSCGVYHFCGYCANGQECNPDTNKCGPAQAVTCADLGYECGAAWLGSGDVSVKTNCGTCGNASTPRCNSAFNVCEPATCKDGNGNPVGSVPPWKVAGLTAQQIKDAKKAFCDAARQAKGIECGIITDGCGGTIDCTTQAAGYVCPAGQGCGVRGVANRCEPFPTPPECETLGMNCGQITSACTGQKITCGVCGVAGEVCNDNNICGPPCAVQKCPAVLPQGTQCGTFSDGCKGNVTCACPSGGKCLGGQCCTPKTCGQLVGAGQCGNGLDDGCGGKVNCGCGGGQTCQAATGTVGSCCTRKTCGTDYPGQCGTNLDDGCGGTIDCNCNGGTCITGGPPGNVTSPGQTGTCCNEAAACTPGSCNTTVPSTCVAGQNISCNCTGGQICNGNTCCSLPDCNGACNTTVSNACGSRQCNCGGGQICLGNNTCCSPKNCNSAGIAGKCGDFDDGCGNIISCGCSLPFVCDGPSGQCTCTALKCSDLAAGTCGSYSDNCNGTINCTCAGQQVCNPNTAQCCTALTCSSPQYTGKCGSGFDNGCGGTINCGCSAPNTCGAITPNVCGCKPKTCADYPGQSGTFPDGCNGPPITCSS